MTISGRQLIRLSVWLRKLGHLFPPNNLLKIEVCWAFVENVLMLSGSARTIEQDIVGFF